MSLYADTYNNWVCGGIDFVIVPMPHGMTECNNEEKRRKTIPAGENDLSGFLFLPLLAIRAHKFPLSMTMTRIMAGIARTVYAGP